MALTVIKALPLLSDLHVSAVEAPRAVPGNEGTGYF
jgi:hypothetical protein